MCDRDKPTHHSEKNMFRAIRTCTNHFSHSTCLHSRDLFTALLVMVIFSLSLSSCVFMCACVSVIPSRLWEAGKQRPVGDCLLRSISYHQGNRAAPSMKLTFQGTIRKCVCPYGFNIKANVNTIERKMCGGFPRKKNMFRAPMSEAVTNSAENDDHFWYTMFLLSFRC